jgi:putative transposase
VIRVYRYRLYPTRAQERVLVETCERLRELYNAALQERRDAYRKTGKSLSAYAQHAEIADVRVARPEYNAIHTHLMQDAITRLDRAYQAFFRRVKAGEKPGFPRFKGRGRYRSFVFKDAANGNGAKLASGGKRLRLSSIGNVKIKMHRPVEGRVKTIGVTLDGDGHWYAAIACDGVPAKPLEAAGRSIGIDLGLTSFIVTSEGEAIEHPRAQRVAQSELARAQRKVARRKRGSKRRYKAVVLLAKKYARVTRVRKDHAHKTALGLLRKYDTVAIENLNVKGMARGRLARSVHDASWASFTTILCNKAESAGCTVIAVNPRGTSQDCSACGERVVKTLRERIHVCPACGLVLDRDVNAARNILARALSGALGETKAGARPSRRSRAAVGAKKRAPTSSSEDPRSPSLAR